MEIRRILSSFLAVFTEEIQCFFIKVISCRKTIVICRSGYTSIIDYETQDKWLDLKTHAGKFGRLFLSKVFPKNITGAKWWKITGATGWKVTGAAGWKITRAKGWKSTEAIG